MKISKIKKLSLRWLVLIQIFLISAYPVFAIKIPSATDSAKKLEKRYNLNLETIRNAGHSFNTASSKGNAPQVMLFFSPSDPKQGEKLTAEASPLYFSNPKESMYYTWYLMHKDCFKGKLDDYNDGVNNYNMLDFYSKEDAVKARRGCNLDGDNEITYNDWKIEAARIIANNGYDTSEATYDLAHKDNEDFDRDGYLALWGGGDRDPKSCGFDKNYRITNNKDPEMCKHAKSAEYAYCYVRDFRTGINYELNDNGAHASFTCPGNTTAKCAVNNELYCPGNISGTGGNIAASTFNEYLVCSDTEEVPYCENGQAVCAQGTPVCAENITEYDCNVPPFSYTSRSCATLYGTAPIPCSFTSESSGKGRNLCRHLFPDYKNFSGNVGYESFAGLKGFHPISNELNNEQAGDGEFNEEEELFWKTDPADPDTSDNGNKDEANVVGLGVYNFTWNYMPGDQIGVAVEGNSLVPTQHAGPDDEGDSSMMIMWAFPNNKCSPPDESKGSYSENVKGYPVTFPTTNMNVNECIYDNLVDPRQGGQSKNIDVSLSYSPENPLNDPTPDISLEKSSGDVLVVQASSTNTDQDSNAILYDWQIEIARGGIYNSMTDWDNITQALISNKLISRSKGNGLSTLKIALNLSDTTLNADKTTNHQLADYINKNMGFLKIKALLSENFAYGKSREGRSDVIVKFNSSGEKIRAYMVQLAEPGSGGKLLIDENIINGKSHPICEDFETGQTTPFCYTIKNDIIGVRVDNLNLQNFSWTLNGKPLLCNSTISNECSADGTQNNVNFFPTPGDPGTQYTLNATAVNVETGETVNLTRKFQVIDPYVKIATHDDSLAWPKLMGDYTNLEGEAFPDMSDTTLETFSGSKPLLRAEFHPSWLSTYLESGNLQLEWLVDGIKTDPLSDQKYSYVDPLNPAVSYETQVVELPEVTKEIGDAYNVILKSIFQMPSEYRQILLDLWGISQLDSTRKYMEDSIQIEVVPPGNEQALGKSKSLLASFLSNLPGQITFLLRIMLTIAVIILTAGIVFAFTPEPYENKNNYY